MDKFTQSPDPDYINACASEMAESGSEHEKKQLSKIFNEIDNSIYDLKELWELIKIAHKDKEYFVLSKLWIKLNKIPNITIYKSLMESGERYLDIITEEMADKMIENGLLK